MKYRDRKRTMEAKKERNGIERKGKNEASEEASKQEGRRKSTPMGEEEEDPRRAPPPRRTYFKGTEGFIYLLIGNHRTFLPCTISNDFAGVTSKSFYGRFNCILLILPSP